MLVTSIPYNDEWAPVPKKFHMSNMIIDVLCTVLPLEDNGSIGQWRLAIA